MMRLSVLAAPAALGLIATMAIAFPAYAQPAEPAVPEVAACGPGPAPTPEQLAEMPVGETTLQTATGNLTTLRYTDVNGQAVLEGDICLGPAEAADVAQNQGVAVVGRRWPGGVVPYVVSSANRSMVEQAIAHWNTNTGIRLVPRTSQTAFVDFVRGNGCSSAVGMTGSRQQINLQDGCGVGSTIHEIGHAVGLFHEQSREDRDEWVRINFANVQAGTENNFVTHVASSDDVGGYDYGSIMHYSANAFSRNGQPTIVQLREGPRIGSNRSALSEGDKSSIAEMYRGIVAPPTTPPAPTTTPPAPTTTPPAPTTTPPAPPAPPTTTPPAPPQPLPAGPATYTITSAGNGLRLAVDAGATRDGGVVIVTDSTTQPDDQRWRIDSAQGGGTALVNVRTGKCTDVTQASLAEFALVHQWACSNYSHQKVQIRPAADGTYEITAGHSNKCLSISTAVVGSQIVQTTCTGAAGQRWRFSTG